jgi:hypothetical protein
MRRFITVIYLTAAFNAFAQVAKYIGVGSTNDATNFICKAPWERFTNDFAVSGRVCRENGMRTR